ncbi:uncharacterized protein DNG_06671 [Cephalotrichum gorgonifer]|uniref:Alcohol acetyltransferase FCK4 n=1 Tax=Cephalotrichum gorgonifer TaxID=2041049 RepID=A0AAE8SWS2_9PEZI|nr:uncharacterized protein DNG_06671 [Cephalotrichum gorgonifer]
MGKPAVVRPCGKLEQYSTARHALGLNRCVSIAGQYEAPRPLDRQTWEKWILTALASVVEREPFLRVGIVDEDSPQPCFVHVPRIDLETQVVWHSAAPCESDDEYQTQLARVLESGHDTLWPDIETRPPWKVTIVDRSDGGSSETSRLDIVYSWHHGIGDGLSGKLFHEFFLSALRENDVPSGHAALESPVLHFQEAPVLPPPQEEAVNFTLSWWFIAKTIWGEICPSFLAPKVEPAWAGEPIDIHGHFKSNVGLLFVDGKAIDGVLAVCRMHGTTLTGLVHALTVLSLARQLPSEKSFKSGTPMSLRPYVSVPDFNPSKSMSVLVAPFEHSFLPETVGEIQSLLLRSEGGATALEEKLWEIAVGVKADLKRGAEQLPADNVMGMIHWVTDWREKFRKMDGKPTEATFEVSNVGVIAGDGDGGEVKITRLVFSQAKITGTAFNVNIAGCNGSGGVAITLTWMDGIIEDKVVKGIKNDLGTWLRNLAQHGRL